jgi:hypothetical protein
MNWKGKTFDNYEVFWEEERSEIDLWHKLQTTFDFKEANKATKKALEKQKNDTSVSTAREDDDDWGGPASTPSSDASKTKGGGGGKKGDDHY